MTSFAFTTNITAPIACMQDYQLKQTLGSGIFSTVWEACQETKCAYAVKVVIIQPDNLPPLEGILGETTTEANFWQEVTLVQTASKLGVGPTYYNAWICDQPVIIQGRTGYYLGFIVMSKIHISLRQWAERFSKLYFTWKAWLETKIREKLKVLLDAGLVYKDLHAGNIGLLIKYDLTPREVVILDYSPLFVLVYPQGEVPTMERDHLLNELLPGMFTYLDSQLEVNE